MWKRLSSKGISPTQKHIILISVLLTFAVQLVMAYIGLTYANYIHQIVEKKREINVFNNVFRNSTLALNNINNLMQLLQTSDFNSLFLENMAVRNPESNRIRKAEFEHKLNEINLVSNGIKSIYFIGSNQNQLSLFKDTRDNQFGWDTQINMDLLEQMNLLNVFLRDHDRLSIYSKNELIERLASSSNETQLALFAAAIEDHPVYMNINNGLLIIVVLKDDFFQKGLPEQSSVHFRFSLIDDRNRLIWSNETEQKLTRDAINSRYIRISKELTPFPYKMVYMQKNEGSGILGAAVWIKFIILSVVTQFITLLVVMIYTKRMFLPFLFIARKMKGQSQANVLSLKEIPETVFKKGLHSLTLRNKLILIFSISVIIPTISNGFTYSQFLQKTVNKQMNVTVNDLGNAINSSIRIRVNYFNNLINQLSVSQQLQDYLTKQQDYAKTNLTAANNISISMFPGLNDISYMVLYDSTGKSFYSSAFSNNLDLFQIEKEYLLRNLEPYWIQPYHDVFMNQTFAVMKQIEHYKVNTSEKITTYLLLIPKATIFEELNTIESEIKLTNEQGDSIYSLNGHTLFTSYGILEWKQPVPDNRWFLTLKYADGDITGKSKQYYYQFLLVINIVFVISVLISSVLSIFLIKPINQLKMTMLAVSEGELKEITVNTEQNEISAIIASFNDMIRQLDRLIQENVAVMEENSSRKIKENELIALKMRAELQMLQAQINPHFLYNTLEAINMCSLKSGNYEVSRMVKALSELFRNSIESGVDMVLLEKELDHVRNFVAIHQFRFGDSFQFEVDIPDALLAVPILKFILQPIVENALKHGLTGFHSGGLIRIQVRQWERSLHITLFDNGVGMDEEKRLGIMRMLDEGYIQKELNDAKAGGIGLINVYERLRLHYGSDVKVDILSKPMKGTTILLQIPLGTKSCEIS